MPPTRKVVQNVTLGALILFVVWFPLINDYLWLFKSWITLSGFEIPDYYEGDAPFGSMTAPRLEAQVVQLPGRGCSDLDYVHRWNGTEPAVAIVRNGDTCPDDTLVYDLQIRNFAGVILICTEWPKHSCVVTSAHNKTTKEAIEIPWALVTPYAAKSIQAAGSVEFVALVSHNNGLAIGGISTFVLFMAALALCDSIPEGYHKTGTDSNDEGDNKNVFKDEEPRSTADSGELVSPTHTQVGAEPAAEPAELG